MKFYLLRAQSFKKKIIVIIQNKSVVISIL